MSEYITSVGLDVHKRFHTVALAPAEGEAMVYGEIANTPAALAQLVRKLSKAGKPLRFGYEAGPCGYGICRQLRSLGQVCLVVALR